MSEVQTNAINTRLASVLANVDGGVLVSLSNYRKKGVLRGRKGAKTVYDDDYVHVLVWSGYEYRELVALSDRYMLELEQSGTMIRTLLKEAADLGHTDITVEEAFVAAWEQREAFRRVLNGSPSEGTSSHVFRPLEVEGLIVRGCRVYAGPGGADERSPRPGTIYLTGLKVGERILRPAPNGTWPTAHKNKTVIKDLLKAKLPIGRFVQYTLTPGTGFKLRLGKEASKAADADNVRLQAEAVHDIVQLAA